MSENSTCKVVTDEKTGGIYRIYTTKQLSAHEAQRLIEHYLRSHVAPKKGETARIHDSSSE